MRSDTPSPEWYEPRDLDHGDLAEHVTPDEPLLIRDGFGCWRLTDDD